MSDDTKHHELRMALGAYVLGHLDEPERKHVEAHVASCARCRREVDELLPVANQLALAVSSTPARVDDPPADLIGRIESEIALAARRDRRDVRRRFLGAAAVGAVAASVIAAALVFGLDRTEPQPTVPLEAVSVDVREPDVTATADLVAHTWGVEVKLRATGLDEGARFRVAVIGRDGSRHSAGEFVCTGDNEMNCNLNSAVLRNDAVGFVVEDRAGSMVVSSDFDPPVSS